MQRAVHFYPLARQLHLCVVQNEQGMLLFYPAGESKLLGYSMSDCRAYTALMTATEGHDDPYVCLESLGKPIAEVSRCWGPGPSGSVFDARPSSPHFG